VNGRIINRFKHEGFEKNYEELNTFLLQINGLGSQDLDSLDNSFDLDDRTSTTSTVTQDLIVDQDPIPQSHKRFKTTNDDAVNRLKAQKH